VLLLQDAASEKAPSDLLHVAPGSDGIAILRVRIPFGLSRNMTVSLTSGSSGDLVFQRIGSECAGTSSSVVISSGNASSSTLKF